MISFLLEYDFHMQACCFSYVYCNVYPCFLLNHFIGWDVSCLIFLRSITLDTKAKSDLKDSNFLGIYGVDKLMLVDALTVTKDTPFDQSMVGLIPMDYMSSTNAYFQLNTLEYTFFPSSIFRAK
jgi:hypothetical protein